MKNVDSLPTRWTRWILAVLLFAGFASSAAFIPAHGLLRDSVDNGRSTYGFPGWLWPYMDGAGFGYTDLTPHETELRLVGSVRAPSGDAGGTERWRITHRGNLEVSLDSVALIDESEYGAETVVEVDVPWKREFGDLRVVLHPTLEEMNKKAPRFEFSIRVKSPWGTWRLIPEERLFRVEPSPEVATRVSTWLMVRKLCLLGLFLLGLHGAMGALRHIWRRSPIPFAVGAATYGAALLIRVMVLTERFANDHRIETLSANADNYVLQARETLSGGVSAVQGAFFSPGPSWWLMGLTTIFGPELWKLYAVNVVVNSFCISMLGYAVAKTRGTTAGVLTGIMAAGYGPLVFYGTTLQIATIATGAMCALIALVFLHWSEPRGRLAFLSGMVLGAAALARPTHLLLAPVLFFAMVLRRRFRDAALLTAGTLALVLPQTALNFRSESPSLISSNGPINLLLGNNRDAYGDFWHTEAFKSARSWAVQNDRSFTEAALREVRLDPVRALGLYLLKCGQVFSNERPTGVISYPTQGLRSSATLRRTTLGGRIDMRLLTWLAAFGAAVSLARRKEPQGGAPILLLACTAVFSLGTAIVFVNSRIRAPLIPFLIILGALGLAAVISRRPRWGQLLGYGLAATAFVALASAAATYLPWKSFMRELPATAVPVENGAVSQGLSLVGYAVEPGPPGELQAGRPVRCTLYWRAEAPMDVDHQATLALRPKTGTASVAASSIGSVSYPDRPTSTWREGDILAESYHLPVRRDAVGEARLDVSVEGHSAPIALGEVWNVAPYEPDPAPGS